jgi:thiol:disulfide interchange protein
MSKVNEITSASQLQRLLSANKAVIVDFYATWCVLPSPSPPNDPD